MKRLFIFAALFVLIHANGCHSTPQRDKAYYEDYMRFAVYNEKGKIWHGHFLFRDGGVQVGRKANPKVRHSNGYILDAGQTTRAWQLADSIIVGIEEGSYLNLPHEQCRVEIHKDSRKYLYEFTHDKNCSQVSRKLRELMLILYGLTDW